MKVRQLMTKEVATIAESASLKEAVRMMIECKVSGLPVLDAGGRVVGIVSEGDVVHQETLRSATTPLRSFFRSTEEASTTVAEAMTAKVISIGGDADHTEAARLMESSGVKRLPVIGPDGALLGIISRSDVLRVFGRPDSDIRDEIVAEVIERILWLDPAVIQVKVEDGTVNLAGTVPTRSDARILEEMSKRIDGVVKVGAERLGFDLDDTKSADSPMSGRGPSANW
jgi:CBS domain-containing protein